MNQPELYNRKYYLMYLRKSSESDERQIQSLEDQRRENKELAKRYGLQIFKTYSESKSSKQPGREEFNKMIALISERNDIKGIIAWEFNRLSRNPVDTATLQWALQQGKIEEIVTTKRTYTIDDSALLMGLEGGVANQFILDLKKATLRGINSKVEKGIAPILAPVGYRNDTAKPQGQKDILPHESYFPLMRKLFEMFMTGNYSVQKLANEADDMGIKNNRGSKPISKSQMHKVLQNPFYTGKFLYKGEIHQGNHPALITDDEYEVIQEVLKGNSKSRPQKPLEFSLNGFVKCHRCGMFVTGERHIKHYKNGTSHEFRHYRCSKRSKTIKCDQKYVREKDMEDQVKVFLERVEIDPDFANWAAYWCNYLNKQQKSVRNAEVSSLQKAYRNSLIKLDNLLDTKLSPLNKSGELLSEEDYLKKRNELVIERDKAKVNLDKLDKKTDVWDEMTVRTFDFAATAKEKFEKGDLVTKQLIIRGIGSYLTLSGQNLYIQPRSPFIKVKEKKEGFVLNEKPVFKPNTDGFYPQNLYWGG